MGLNSLHALRDYADSLNTPFEYIFGIPHNEKLYYLSSLFHSFVNPFELWLDETKMTENRSISWADAEKSFPECTAAWDRDIGIDTKNTISDIVVERDRLVVYIAECEAHKGELCICMFYDNKSKSWKKSYEYLKYS